MLIGYVQRVELDLIAEGRGTSSTLEEDFSVSADLSRWYLEGGLTMSKEEHREHLRKLFRLGQR